MGWTAPITFTVGQVLTAAQMNTNLRDNLNYLKSGSSAQVTTSQTTTSTTFADLATSGPAVTVTTDVQAWVILSCNVSNSGANASNMGVAVSGASTIAAADLLAVGGAGSAGQNVAGIYPITGLTAGSNIFTAKYRTVGGTATFVNRILGVIPA